MRTMSKRMKDNYCYLQSIQKAHPHFRKAIIQKAPNELIKALAELALNTLAGHIDLARKDKQKLYPYRHQIRALASKQIPLAKKRKQCCQKGGFLPALIGPALSVLAAILGEFIAKRK
jgi:hypothetical protein